MDEYEIYEVSDYTKYTLKNAEKFTGNIDEIKKELKKDKSYHEKIYEKDLLIFNIDLDGCDEFEYFKNYLLKYLKEEYDILIDKKDMKYTENFKSIEKKSYHLTIPKLNANSLNLKIFWEKFKRKYEKNIDCIDTGHLGVKNTGKWFRLPNQKKGIDYKKIKNVKEAEGTEHIIQNGSIKNFVLKYIPSKSVNIDGLIEKKNNNLIKEIPKNKQETIKQKINIEILDKDDIFKKFIEKCYDKERSRDYTSWRNMAFALKNSYDNDYAKNLLLLFSKLCPEKFNEEGIINFWNNIKTLEELEKCYNIDHLYKWARLDNRQMYNNILENDIYYRDIEDKINHSDIPRYIKKLEPNKFIWTGNDLYCYDGKKWNNNNLEFGRYICEDLYNHLLDLITSYKIESKEFSQIKKKLNKLKDADFKRKVIETSKEVFTNNKIEFDMDGNLLGFENGVYDLEKGEFRDFKYDDYITFSVGYDYKKDYDESKMNKLKELIKTIIPNEENRKLYLEILATGLEGKTLEKFIIFNGAGGNGKGLMDSFVCETLGKDYTYEECPASLLTEKQTTNANPAKFKLNKKRLVFIKEPEEKQPFNNSMIKEITGDSYISGRNLHSNNSNINLHLTLICECNKKPPLTSEPTEAERRRFIDILFPNIFTDDENIVNNKTHFKANKEYKEKKWRESYKYELLHLLLENYKNYNKRNKNLIIPDEIKKRTDEYLEKSFTIMSFFNESYKYSEDSKDYLKIEDIILSYRASEDYINLTKNEKRKLNKAYFINFFSTNYKFSKYYNERKNIKNKYVRNIITNYKEI